ncbi:MAG: squalene--hopene cyclase [Candidatus Binatia bacterium]|nr:squalene--hopene cyclase [Candidatus Binatia bacterium]
MNDMLRSQALAPSASEEIGSEIEKALDETIRRTQSHLLRIQSSAGYWHFPLEANVTMDAEYVFFNRFMRREAARPEARLTEHMLSTQNPDGSWSLYPGGPGNVSLTIEAYFALKLCGFSVNDNRLTKAREFIRAQGGLARAGVFTRCFLAYFGQFPWYGLPSMPVELILLPPWFPVNIYAFSSWARETVVPLTILMALRPQIPLGPEFHLQELWLEPPSPDAVAFPRGDRTLSWRNFFLAVDATLKLLGKHVPWAPLRRHALRRAEQWILERQDRNGGWGGIQPPMLNCVMALKTLGYPDDHPVILKGIQAIDDFLIADGDALMMQPCVSPTWDTALAAKALLDSGLNADHPALSRAAEWLIQNQIFRRGDWSIYNPDLDPGGWAFEFANDWYPDVDDTAVILMQLQRIHTKNHRAKQRAIAYGLNWALGMQSQNGGWAAFDTDNDSEFLNQIPFADMEAMIDPPTEDLTGRLLELMGQYGYDLQSSRVRKAHRFLLRTQRPHGAWWGRWGANFIYGTWSVLSGLRAIGDDLRASHVRRAVAWLKHHQNPDGGWGETLASYDDESLAGRGESTASQTAWAILGLLAGEDGVSPELLRGVRFLLQTQKSDGTWEERLWTGTGFPRHFYLRYDGYRIYFPLMALGQVRQRLQQVRSGRASAENTHLAPTRGVSP